MLKRKMVKGLLFTLGVSMLVIGGKTSITNASALAGMNVSRTSSDNTPTKMSVSNIASNSIDSIDNKVDEIKYILLCEGKSYDRYETAKIAFKEDSHETPSVFIDDFTILDAMDYAPYAQIATFGEINCNNSIKIYFPVNEGIDFHRAVANFILYYRSELKNKFPNAKLITKTKAMELDMELEESRTDVNRTKILDSNSSWWTFDKIVELCSNEELIPFIDYCPVEDNYSIFNLESVIKESFPVFEGKTIRESVNSQIVETFHENEESSNEVEEDVNSNFFDKIKKFFKKNNLI